MTRTLIRPLAALSPGSSLTHVECARSVLGAALHGPAERALKDRR